MAVINPRNKHETFLVFSPNCQTGYGTALGDTAMTLSHDHHPGRVKETFKTESNKDQAGRGHEFASRIMPLTADTSLAVSFDVSSLIAAWITGLGCGKVTVTQPDDVGSPDVYTYTIEPMNIYDAAVGKQLPTTTVVQLKGSSQTKYRDMVVSDFAISGKREEQLKCEANFTGSGFQEAAAVTLPAHALVSFLKTHGVTFTIGGVDRSAELLDFKFAHKNALSPGYHPGSGVVTLQATDYQVKGNCLIQRREVDLEFRMIQTADTESIYQAMLANTVQSLEIKAVGQAIDATYNHEMKITTPVVFFDTVDEGEDNEHDTYDVKTAIGFDENNKRPYVIEITTDQGGLLQPA